MDLLRYFMDYVLVLYISRRKGVRVTNNSGRCFGTNRYREVRYANDCTTTNSRFFAGRIRLKVARTSRQEDLNVLIRVYGKGDLRRRQGVATKDNGTRVSNNTVKYALTSRVCSRAIVYGSLRMAYRTITLRLCVLRASRRRTQLGVSLQCSMRGSPPFYPGNKLRRCGGVRMDYGGSKSVFSQTVS